MTDTLSSDYDTSKLDERTRDVIASALIANLYDRTWCRDNEVSYENPEVDRAKELTIAQLRESGQIPAR